MMDLEEFKRQWLPLGPAFYRLAWSILRSEADAQDAVQELYARLWDSRRSLDGVRMPKAYGLVLLRNLCIDMLRGRRPAENVDGVQAAADDGGEETGSADRLRRLKAAMKTLSPEEREVLELRFFRRLSYEAMSERTGLSPGNLRVRVSRARKTLKKRMEAVGRREE